eukprot:13181755-Ditylum_brightwellii.AAC.1
MQLPSNNVKLTQKEKDIRNSTPHRHSLIPKRKHIFRVIFQNVNGIPSDEDQEEYMQDMHAKHADLYGWAETKVSWTELCKNQTEYHGCCIHDNYKLITALSNEPAEYKQPGGTCLALVDKL